MAGPHGPLHATGGRNHGTGRRHPLTGAHGRRQGAARPRGPHRRLRPREVRGFPQTAHRSGQSRAATAQDGAGDRQVQYRSLPQGTAPAAGRHRSDARRAVRAACRSHRPRGALRPGRQCHALLDGADARPPRPDRRVRRGHTLHPGRARREDRPRGAFRRRPVRRRPHLRRRRGAGRGRHGLRHGKHPARGKNLRPGKPVRHPRQAAGKHRGRGRRPAGRPFGGDGAGRQQRPGGIRRRRSAVAGRARGRQPGHPGRSVSHGR